MTMPLTEKISVLINRFHQLGRLRLNSGVKHGAVTFRHRAGDKSDHTGDQRRAENRVDTCEPFHAPSRSSRARNR